MELYENIRKRREELGMSQDELAKLMGYKSRASINKIEMGKADIPQSKIAQFARVLNISPGELMGWDKNKVATVAASTALGGAISGPFVGTGLIPTRAFMTAMAEFMDHILSHADPETKKKLPIIVEGQREKALLESYRSLPQKDKETVLSLIQSLSKNAATSEEDEYVWRQLSEDDTDDRN